MIFLTVIGLVIIIALIANVRQDKSNEEYEEYLLNLESEFKT